MAIIKLGRAGQHLGDDSVSGFEFFEDGEGLLHKR
jgi:hypothetical protein